VPSNQWLPTCPPFSRPGTQASCGSTPCPGLGRVLAVGVATYLTVVVALRLPGKRVLTSSVFSTWRQTTQPPARFGG
jgi:hypothetical protein